MLRNNYKSSFYRLIILFGAILSACSETRSLLGNPGRVQNSSLDLKIKADPYEEYRIRGIVEKQLPLYVADISMYKIDIEVKGQTASAVYTERQVTKEQIRMAAKITISDKHHNQLSEQVVDAFSTYEVCDDLPFSVLASKKQARDTVLNELANAIILSVSASVKSNKS